VVNVDGTGERTIYKNDNAPQAVARAWTPDGAAVLVAVYVTTGERQILLIKLSDGSVRLLRAERGPHRFRSMALSPTGRFLAFSWGGSIYALDLQSPGRAETPAALADDDWANDLLGWSPDGNHILYVSDRTGGRDAWLLPVQDGKPAGEPRLAKSALATAEAYLSNTANEIVPMGFARRGTFYYGVDRTDTDAMSVVLDPASGRIEGPPLRFTAGFDGSTFGLQWSPDGKRALCQRGDMLLLRNLDSRSWREVRPRIGQFENARWHPDGQSLIVVGRAGGSRGVYQIDVESGAASEIVLDLPATANQPPLSSYGGRTIHWTRSAVVSGDGQTLYRAVDDRQGGMWAGGRVVARNLRSGEESVIHRTRQDEVLIADIALSPDGTQVASLNTTPSGLHRIYVFPVSGEKPENPPLYSARHAMQELFFAITWLPDGKSLLASVNRFPASGELWRIPLDGGQPQTWRLPFLARVLHVHPDGRRIGITAWKQVSEVWALENFLPRAAK